LKLQGDAAALKAGGVESLCDIGEAFCGLSVARGAKRLANIAPPISRVAYSFMRAPVLLIALALAAASVAAAPFVPSDEGQILERLPYRAADPAQRELSALRAQLAREPGDLALALRVARRYVELGRTSGDPRYAGYAQAALAPWWELRDAPPEVLVLRATLRQRLHQFDAALADLDAVLKTHPRNAQARLTKATVLLVRGEYGAARDECGALRPLTQESVATMCLASVDALTGKLREGYDRLRLAVGRGTGTDPGVGAWLSTALAEMAARAGMASAAEAHFREALTLDPADSYLLGAYADFLLDAQRAGEVLPLLANALSADALLLRYTLALKALGARDFAPALEQLHARVDASRLRGDRVHLREEARFTLHLLGDASTALKLAQENWVVQKEPADLRLLLEAALAARDAAARRTALDWIAETRLEDVQLSRLAASAMRAVNPD
jgi:Tfp pilus assembly protein PilF